MRSPLTLLNNSQRVQTFNTKDLVNQWISRLSIDPFPFFCGVEEISKWKCLDSGLTFYYPVECAGPEALYKELRTHAWYYLQDKWEYDEALTFLPRQGHLLEVGCGSGHFLRKAVRMNLRTEGLEMTMPDLSNPAVQDLSISEASVQEHAEKYPGAYDIVCSFQVLEHVVDPRGFLEASVKLLAPGGKLLISTPNARSFLRHAFNILDMPPHHMTGWSEESYRFLQSILPVKLERVLYEPLADYHIDYFVDTYSSRFNGKFDVRGAWARGAYGELSKRLLRAGGRRFFRGQSMLAIFKKREP